MHRERELDTDVAIVGCGPTGALLANYLGKAGVRVAVYERDATIHSLPRAVHFDGEIMRIMQAIGLAQAVAGIARPSSKGMHFVNATDETLLVRRGVDGPGVHGWANDWYFHQPDLDAVLRAGISQLPDIALRLGHEVRSLEQTSDGVRLQVVELATGSANEAHARYIVGCDGARSQVRETIGAHWDDLGLHQPWLVVDVLLDTVAACARQLPDYTVQHCDPARPMTHVFVADRRHRWEIMLMPGDDVDAITQPAQVWALLAGVIGPGDGKIERAAVYAFHALIASPWRNGRLLLAGDSCHQTPPFLGQGMCAGMRDVANLAWKLRHILRCGANERILDSYEIERRPHVQSFIELAVRLGGIIQTTDVEAAAMRDRDFRTKGTQLFDFPQPRLGSGLQFSTMSPDGEMLPQTPLSGGPWLDDVIGNRFAVVMTPLELSITDDSIKARLAQSDIALVAADESLCDWFVERGLAAVIVRPDRYIFASLQTAPQLAAVLDKLAELGVVHSMQPSRS